MEKSVKWGDATYRHNVEGIYPWVPAFLRRLPTRPRRGLRGDTLYIASDYSGEDSKSRYEIFTFVLFSPSDSVVWQALRMQVRSAYMADGRRMAFKNLGDRQRRAAVPRFLEAARSLPGLCITVAVRKSIRDLCHGELFLDERSSLRLEHKWTKGALERTARITHFVALLVARYSSPGQNVYWVSDQDELFANLARTSDLTAILGMWCGMQVRHELGELGAGTTAMDPGDRFEEDLAAIADLVAGATREYLNRGAEQWGGHIPSGIVLEEPQNLSDRTQLILSWLAADSALEHETLLFEEANNGYSLSNVSLVG